MDPYGYDDGADDQQAQALAALAGIPLQQAKIEAKRRRGQAMFATPTPGGREVGRTYVASSPLEHLAAAMTRTMGLRDMKAADADMAPIIQQQQAGAAAQARQQLADKRFGQSIQLGGLRRQEAADAATREHQAATLTLQQQEAARKARADEAEAQYRAGLLGVQQEGLGLKRREIDVQRELKAAEAAAKAKGDKSKAAEDLRKEFQGLQTYKNTQTVAETYRKIQNTAETGPGDMSLIFSYMKMLDPGSTVREGEYATAQNAGSVPQNIVAAYNRAVGGEKLAPEVRSQFRDQAKSVLKAQADRYEETATPYRRLAEQAGVSPADVVLDLGLQGLMAPTSAAAPVRKFTRGPDGKLVEVTP